MLYSQRKPLQIRQNALTLLFISFDGAAATPVASGLDAKFVKEIQDLGTGSYKIVFKDKARRNLLVVGTEVATDGIYSRVVAVDGESVTIATKTFAGAAADAALSLTVASHQDKTLY